MEERNEIREALKAKYRRWPWPNGGWYACATPEERASLDTRPYDLPTFSATKGEIDDH